MTRWHNFYSSARKEYYVSTEGIIKSVDNKTLKERNLRPSRAFTCISDTQGYLQIAVKEGKKNKTLRVHTVVVQSFVGVIPKGYEVNHKDGNKHNNRVENLEIVTPRENMLHAYKHNLINFNYESTVGTNNPIHKRFVKRDLDKLVEAMYNWLSEEVNMGTASIEVGKNRAFLSLHLGKGINRKLAFMKLLENYSKGLYDKKKT